jgi:hypothetical protein
VLMVALLAAAMYWCASAAGAEPRLAALVTLLLAASPMLLGMSYSISSDLSGAALCTAGLALVARGWPFVGGLLAGASLLTRVTDGWIALAAVLLLLRSPSVLRFVLGCIPPVAVLLAMNWHMFGSPFRMSYDNVLVLVQGQHAIASHSGLFDRALGTGMMEQMFEWPRGLAFSAPLATLAWLGLPLLVKQRALLGLATLVGAGGLYATFAMHVYTGDSPFGLRYLLPIIGLAAVPLGALLQQVLARRGVTASAAGASETSPDAPGLLPPRV